MVPEVFCAVLSCPYHHLLAVHDIDSARLQAIHTLSSQIVGSLLGAAHLDVTDTVGSTLGDGINLAASIDLRCLVIGGKLAVDDDLIAHSNLCFRGELLAFQTVPAEHIQLVGLCAICRDVVGSIAIGGGNLCYARNDAFHIHAGGKSFASQSQLGSLCRGVG